MSFSIRDEQGNYTWKSDKIPSVTRILNPYTELLEAQLTSIRQEVERLSCLIDSGGMAEMWVMDELGLWSKQLVKPQTAIRDGKYIANSGKRYLKQCADRGSLIHELLCDYGAHAIANTGELEERCYELIMLNHYSCLIDDVYPYAISLWKWLEKNNPTIVLSESPVFNLTQGYAGTCDGVMELDGLMLFDCKTQKDYSAQRSHFAQVAAYAHAEFTVYDSVNALTREFPKVDKCGVLYVTPEKTGLRIVDNWEEYYQSMFLPALTAYKARALPMPKEQAQWVK